MRFTDQLFPLRGAASPQLSREVLVLSSSDELALDVDNLD